jgi:predicted MPP superfamily phosphohydrolase
MSAPHAPDLDRALHGRDPNGALILLAHQPRQFLEAAQKGVDLTLSGHTHGGQIWPASWLVHLAQPFVAGLHAVNGSQLYVSRGTGFWGPPLRVGAPAEITLLELRTA